MVGGTMFRKRLIDMLLDNPMTVRQIARLEDESLGRVADDLHHLFRSLKHTEYKAVVEPARCRACGFEFSRDKVTKPSKCPECHSTWVMQPRVGIENNTPGGEARSND
jgi:predicted Zn-ribbon and HTH transcriptional regulator